MLKRIGLLGLLVATVPMLGCGSNAKEIAPATEEAEMDPEVMDKMAMESMKHMPPEQQAEMKKQLEAQKKARDSQ